MKTLSGVTAGTTKDIQLGAGVLTTAYSAGGVISTESIIGATRGGGSFSAVPTIRSIDADGIAKNTKGMIAIDEWDVKLNTTLIEFKKDGIMLALGAGAKSEEAELNVTKITATNDVSASDYKDIYWIGNLMDGRKAVILLKNALSMGGFNLTIANKGEGTYALNLTGNYDIADMETAPFEIIIDGKNVVL